jgi:hypothetical protein
VRSFFVALLFAVLGREQLAMDYVSRALQAAGPPYADARADTMTAEVGSFASYGMLLGSGGS